MQQKKNYTNKHITCVLLFILSVTATRCSKNKPLGAPTTNTGNGTTGSNSDTTITPPNNPAFANTIGFFGDNWTAKTFVTPAYNITPHSSVNTTVNVSIDMSNVITKVSPHLFGNNSNLWMGQIVVQPVLMNYLKDLSPGIIRGPAGSNSDVYFWNQSSAPPADAPDSIYENATLGAYGYWYGGNTQSWTFSLNNYYQLLQQTNSDGILTVNYGYARYGTSANPVAAAAHLAADWVRYDNGKTKYWEIGNECYGNWEAGYEIDTTKNQDKQPQIITGNLYGTHFNVFADSMRAAAKETGKVIYIGAVLLDAPAPSWADATNQTWNQGVLTTAGNTADFFIVHDYFTAYNTNSSVNDILYSATEVPSTAMAYLKNQLDTYGITSKPIAMTEWNIQAVGAKQDVSNIAGVHAVITLGEFIKGQVGEASRWDLANGWNNGDDMGMFNNSAGSAEPGASQWNPRPTFFYMYFFQKYFGDKMVASAVTGDTAVLSYASSFTSGESGIILVNKSSSAKNVKVSINNFRAGTNYYWYTLNGGTDNAPFSQQLYINDTAPMGSTGGPLNYASVKANAATLSGGINISLPGYAVTFIVAENKK